MNPLHRGRESAATVGATAVSRLRLRLFPPWTPSGRGGREAASLAASDDRKKPPATLEAATPARPGKVSKAAKATVAFQAGIAEFLLIIRLRARRPAEPSADVLEHAAHIVFVTCQNWFAPPVRDPVRHRTLL